MPYSLKRPIKITIVDDSKAGKCDVGCGPDWSAAETVALAERRVRDRFGDNIELEYLDLSGPAASHSELNHRIRKENLFLPLLLIDGELRVSGQFDIRLLLDAVEAEIEVRQCAMNTK